MKVSAEANQFANELKKRQSIDSVESPGLKSREFCTFEGWQSFAIYAQRQTLMERVMTFLEHYTHEQHKYLAVEQG